jgi:hypothetical protein
MNSMPPRQTVLLREKPPDVICSSLTEKANVDEGTIRTSRRKARYKSPFMER